MTTTVAFKPYTQVDQQACLDLFDANCPEFFARNERNDYAEFLDANPKGYELCIVSGQVAGAFGLIGSNARRRRLNWIMLNPRFQGMGIGSAIMGRIVALATASELQVVDIAASHKSAPFFAKFGATTAVTTHDGWGPDMHRVDMELWLERTNNSSMPKPLRGSA